MSGNWQYMVQLHSIVVIFRPTASAIGANDTSSRPAQSRPPTKTSDAAVRPVIADFRCNRKIEG